MKKKIMCCMLVCAMSVTMLAGCGNKNRSEDQTGATPASTENAVSGDSSAAQSEAEPVTITIGGWPTPENEQYELTNFIPISQLSRMSIFTKLIPSCQKLPAVSCPTCI